MMVVIFVNVQRQHAAIMEHAKIFQAEMLNVFAMSFINITTKLANSIIR